MINSIRLQNFRSYKDDSFEFEPGVNIVVGPNASGKTNLLEAVLALCRGSSFRARDADLVKFSAPWARLDGFFGEKPRSLKLQNENSQILKTFVIDDKEYKRLKLDQTVPVVLFEPSHLQMITRSPENRREFFDDLLERSVIGFKSLASAYRRTLAQRNALLKQKPDQASRQLFAWNIRLSELGGKIVEARVDLIEDINNQISEIYSKIAGHKSTVKVNYDSSLSFKNYASQLLKKLESTVDVDFARGFTSYGPHREDITFELNGLPLGQAASRGEARSLLLALKIYELGLIENSRGQQPIFLLDDVFSELDGKRRRALVRHLKKHQTIITTTDAEAVMEYFSENAKLLPIK